MLDKSQVIQALDSGDAETLSGLSSSNADQSVLGDGVDSRGRTRRLSQAKLREAVQQVVELGSPCDIWTAARAGLIDHVKQLLAQQPELLDALDSCERTPLQRAALIYGVCKECEEVADLLIAEGAALDVFTAATFCLPDIVHRELERNPDVVSARCQGSTPLHWAVRPRRNFSDAPEICRTLLDGGADVSERDADESGMMPLHHAAEWGPPICLQLVDLLLEAGADINCTDDQGWTPLDYAQDRRRREMTGHLIAHGAVSKA